jgi:CRISPR-associated protein Cas1
VKKLGNTLYITTAEAYVALDGENVVVKKDDTGVMRLPLHNLESIVCFNYAGVSPALMGACAERQIALTFLKPSGQFLARVTGRVHGNVSLRRRQYELSCTEAGRIEIARNMLLGKVANSRKVVERALRDHRLLVDAPVLSEASGALKTSLREIQSATSLDSLRGLEGLAAKRYFEVFDQMILQQKAAFRFEERSRRPPLDNMNALLSFLYSLLTHDAVAALETVGLDPQMGFLHVDRPGRPSLALDLVEELRAPIVDRLALSLVNLRQVQGAGFTRKESGGVLMDDATRKEVLVAWQKRKQEVTEHPFLKERIPRGLLPHVQAMLLARHVRGDLEGYPPYLLP